MSQRRQHREGGVSESGPEYDLQAQVWGEEVGEVPTQSPGTTALSDVPVSFFSSGQFKVSRINLSSSPTNFTSP